MFRKRRHKCEIKVDRYMKTDRKNEIEMGSEREKMERLRWVSRDRGVKRKRK